MLGIGSGLAYPPTSFVLSAPLYSITLDGDGDDDLMTFSSTAFDIDGADYTFSFWAKLDDLDGPMTVLGGASHFKQNISIDLNTGNLILESDTNGDTQQTGTNNIDKDTNWHHYAITVNGGVADGTIIYNDGSKSTTGATSPTGGSYGDNMTVARLGGGGTDADTKFVGHIYQFAIFDKVLSALEISTIGGGSPISLEENYGSYVSTDNLIHLWNFDEGTGSSVADSAGSLTGTLTDDAAFSTDIPS
jgi:hypothetical protein